jgi:hypothetical protein
MNHCILTASTPNIRSIRFGVRDEMDESPDVGLTAKSGFSANDSSMYSSGEPYIESNLQRLPEESEMLDISLFQVDQAENQDGLLTNEEAIGEVEMGEFPGENAQSNDSSVQFDPDLIDPDVDEEVDHAAELLIQRIADEQRNVDGLDPSQYFENYIKDLAVPSKPESDQIPSPRQLNESEAQTIQHFRIYHRFHESQAASRSHLQHKKLLRPDLQFKELSSARKLVENLSKLKPLWEPMCSNSCRSYVDSSDEICGTENPSTRVKCTLSRYRNPKVGKTGIQSKKQLAAREYVYLRKWTTFGKPSRRHFSLGIKWIAAIRILVMGWLQEIWQQVVSSTWKKDLILCGHSPPMGLS